PHAVIFLAGAVSWKEDTAFLERLRGHLPGTLLIGTGDIFLEKGEQLLTDHPIIDAAIVDFSTDDVVRYLEGNTPDNMVIRDDGTVRALPVRRGAYEKFSLPVPRQEIFMRRAYRLPFLNRPFATVLTDFGCPFKCTFCVMSTLGYRYREVGNVLKELSLIRSLGLKHVFFIDQTFRPRRSDNLEMCQAMLREGFEFQWICYSRPDVVNEEVLLKMKEAGCHTIMFGVESGSPRILSSYIKGYTLDRIHETFALCSRLGIRTVGTFILGLPEDTEQSCRETIELACSLDCDYASFNFAVPRAGTPLRNDAVRMGLISADTTVMDQSGSFIVMPTLTLSTERLKQIRRRAIGRYYLRPRYLLKRLRELSSLQELGEAAYAGISLFRNLRNR
ncbi:MAG: radical SAM protein, partial [Candidatus Hydrogenedentota bacterium]